MKILAIIDSLRGGGAERVLSLLCHEWARIGHTVEISTFKESTLPDGEQERLTLHPALAAEYGQRHSLMAKILLLPKLLWRIRTQVRTLQPSVIVCFMDQANILTLLATIGLPVSVVISERIYPAHSSLLIGARKGPVRSLMSLFRSTCYRRAARVILQSDRSISCFPAVMHARIQVIPNPIVFPSRTGIAIEIPQPTILSLGRLTAQKRFDLLIAAFHRIFVKFPEWHLLIAGSGEEAGKLQLLAESGPGSAQIHFLGYQGNTASLYEQSSLFVLASDFEGFPVALGEALITGTPAIASDCLTGPREILGEDRYGILVPPGDVDALTLAILAAIQDPERLKHYAESGKSRAAEFSLQRIAPLWIQMFEEIAKETSNLQHTINRS